MLCLGLSLMAMRLYFISSPERSYNTRAGRRTTRVWYAACAEHLHGVPVAAASNRIAHHLRVSVLLSPMSNTCHTLQNAPYMC